MKSLGVNLETIILKNDDIGAEKLSGNPVFHGRSKYIINKHKMHQALREKLLGDVIFHVAKKCLGDVMMI